MLFPFVFLPLLPLLHSTFATPSPASSLLKRDDCNGSMVCSVSTHSHTAALTAYNATANANTYYYDYTSYTADHFTAIYVCPQGKYPIGVTGAQIFDAGLRVASKCGRCGTHWMYDSDQQLKCRITLNTCSRCKDVVNGRDGDGSGSPTLVIAGAAMTHAADGNQQELHA